DVAAALQLAGLERAGQLDPGLGIEAVPDDLALQLVEAIRQLDQADHAQALEVAHHGLDAAEFDLLALSEEVLAVQVDVGVGDAVRGEACHYSAPPRVTRYSPVISVSKVPRS